MKPRRNKYGAKPKVVDGVRFHSTREANRYLDLKLLEKAGEIRHLKLQPSFVLMAPVMDGALADVNAGKFQRVSPLGNYVADFTYEEKRGTVWVKVVEDCKGYRTDMYRWKRKHVERQYQIEIRET